jgi:hypothetical protein
VCDLVTNITRPITTIVEKNEMIGPPSGCASVIHGMIGGERRWQFFYVIYF